MTIRIKSKVKLTISIMVLLTIIISIFSFFLLKSSAQEPPDSYISWTVAEGDTLWTIAKGSLPKGRDIRDYIIEIRRVNGLDTSNIVTGQQLQIPVYDENNDKDNQSAFLFGMKDCK